MTQLRLNEFVDDHLNDMIFVTGIPRSGTTILGKLVGSFNGVEYAFEPPFVTYINAKHRHGLLDSEAATELLKVYLHFDYFAEYVHGRKYNFRPSDDSYVLGMQTVPEVLAKWDRVTSMAEAMEAAPEYTFSIKVPGVYHVLAVLFESLSNLRVVDIGRNLERVLASLYAKRWFFDENLGPDATGVWPFHDTDGQYLVPYLVNEGDADAWQSMNPETRTVYVCNRLSEDRLAFQDRHDNAEDYYTPRYERLTEDPSDLAENLSKKLDLEWGPKTQSVLEEIEPTTVQIDVEGILDKCERSVEERFLELQPEFKP